MSIPGGELLEYQLSDAETAATNKIIDIITCGDFTNDKAVWILVSALTSLMRTIPGDDARESAVKAVNQVIKSTVLYGDTLDSRGTA